MDHDDKSLPDLDRRKLLAMGAAATVSLQLLASAAAVASSAKTPAKPNEAGPYDLVITGGRVVDPETGLDAVRDTKG